MGAGASKADRALLQNELFKEYFELVRNIDNQFSNNHEMKRELASFFSFMFGLDVDYGNLEKLKFPTFEEALGILDLAESRGEAFREFDLNNIAINSGRIPTLRLYLVLAMTEIIHEKLKTSNRVHKRLIRNLSSNNLLENMIFITTNYDILIDTALINTKYEIDYNVSFSNSNYNKNNSIKLFKIHGSLNWLYCPVCNSLTLSKNKKGVVDLIRDIKNATCNRCESIYSPMIIPPTYFKNMSNVFLSSVWNGAESSLLNTDHIIFCGYSFPDADIHIKYLLKRIETNRNKSLKISVLNHHSDKKKVNCIQEKDRYRRLFKSEISYKRNSFQDFADNPKKFL